MEPGGPPGRSSLLLGPVGHVSTMGEFSLFDLRVIVERIEGRSVCGLKPGDSFEVTESSHIRIPGGAHFCIYALSAILPLLPAVQRRLAGGDWLGHGTLGGRPQPGRRGPKGLARNGGRTRRTEDPTWPPPP